MTAAGRGIHSPVMFNYEDIALEMARIEREAVEAIRRRIASQQLGELWIGLEDETDSSDLRRAA